MTTSATGRMVTIIKMAWTKTTLGIAATKAMKGRHRRCWRCDGSRSRISAVCCFSRTGPQCSEPEMNSSIRSLAITIPITRIMKRDGWTGAKLRIEEFISGSEHWGPVREKQQTAEILDLLSAQRQYLRCRTFIAFVAAVPTVVLVHSILLLVPMRPVTLVVIIAHILQRQAVVASITHHI